MWLGNFTDVVSFVGPSTLYPNFSVFSSISRLLVGFINFFHTQLRHFNARSSENTEWFSICTCFRPHDFHSLICIINWDFIDVNINCSICNFMLFKYLPNFPNQYTNFGFKFIQMQQCWYMVHRLFYYLKLFVVYYSFKDCLYQLYLFLVFKNF